MKLNIGAGKKELLGYISCDKSKETNPDKIVDLEKPLPFEDNSIDLIVGDHILEHINNFIPLMKELRRVCKNKAILKFTVPFYLSVGAFSDPTHVRFFTPFTFHDLVSKEFAYEFGTEGMFKINKVRIIYGTGIASKVNWFMNPLINLSHRLYCKLFAGILPSSEIKFELQIIK